MLILWFGCDHSTESEPNRGDNELTDTSVRSTRHSKKKNKSLLKLHLFTLLLVKLVVNKRRSSFPFLFLSLMVEQA